MITDNALVAFEIFYYLQNQKNRKNCHFALKLDMSKAYDRVEWSFLEAVMRKLGFVDFWVNVVMRCVRTVKFVIQINCVDSSPFFPERGLRQGDPILPYLFILCAELFSHLITRSVATGHLSGVRVARSAPQVRHLLFVDDSILFGKTNMLEGQEIKNILSIYGEVFGHQMNFDKSQLHFSPSVK